MTMPVTEKSGKMASEEVLEEAKKAMGAVSPAAVMQTIAHLQEVEKQNKESHDRVEHNLSILNKKMDALNKKMDEMLKETD